MPGAREPVLATPLGGVRGRRYRRGIRGATAIGLGQGLH